MDENLWSLNKFPGAAPTLTATYVGQVCTKNFKQKKNTKSLFFLGDLVLRVKAAFVAVEQDFSCLEVFPIWLL